MVRGASQHHVSGDTQPSRLQTITAASGGAAAAAVAAGGVVTAYAVAQAAHTLQANGEPGCCTAV